MSLDSWLQRHRRQRLDLDSGEIVSLNLVDRPKPSIDEAPTSTVQDRLHGGSRRGLTYGPTSPRTSHHSRNPRLNDLQTQCVRSSARAELSMLVIE
jgi:hypothetical protein